MKSDKNVHEIIITVDKDIPGHFEDQSITTAIFRKIMVTR